MAAQKEKVSTMVLLEYLAEVDRRKAFADRGFSSLFEYVHRGLGYSETQTSERVNAMRLMRGTSGVKEQLKNGELTLTSASQIQRFFQMEKKISGKEASAILLDAKKTEIISQCLNLPKREVERVLLSKASVPVKVALQEKVTMVDPVHIELKRTLSLETEKKLKRAKELTQHATLAELLDKALSALIEKQEKKMGKVVEKEVESKSTLPATSEPTLFYSGQSPEKTKAGLQQSTSRYIPTTFKRILYQRSQGRCEWIHPTTHKRCQSHQRLHIDHIKPLALGGITKPKNLRHLCATHNLRVAKRAGLS